MGCQAGVVQEAAPAPPPPAVSLNALERLAVKLHDRIEAIGRKPTPEAPPPAKPTMEEVLSEIRTTLAEPPPAPSPPPHRPAPAPASTRAVTELRARRIGRGWLVYADGVEVDVTSDAEIGQIMGALAAR